MSARVTSLHHYPVKGLRGVDVELLVFDALGPLEDRRWMVVDESERFLSQRTHPAMATLGARLVDGQLELSGPVGMLRVPLQASGPTRAVTVWKDTVPAVDAGDAAADFFTQALGRPARLVRLSADARRTLDPAYSPSPQALNGFSDAYPALVTCTASLSAFSAALGHALPMDRFRPNVVLEGTPAWDEDGWGVVKVGALTLDAVKPCVRCAVITTDQRTGERSPEVLTALTKVHAAQGKGAVFGMNLVHRGPGVLRVGDGLEVLERAVRPAWVF